MCLLHCAHPAVGWRWMPLGDLRRRSLQTGDRILSVDGTDLRSASHDQAVAAIRSSAETVEFVVQSLVHRVSSD